MSDSKHLAALERFVWREQCLKDALNDYFDRRTPSSTAKLLEIRASLNQNNYSALLEKLDSTKSEPTKVTPAKSPRFRRYV